MGKRKPRLVAHFEVTVWNQTNGDIERYRSDVLQDELDEIREFYEDEPWFDVVVDREWEEAEDAA